MSTKALFELDNCGVGVCGAAAGGARFPEPPPGAAAGAGAAGPTAPPTRAATFVGKKLTTPSRSQQRRGSVSRAILGRVQP